MEKERRTCNVLKESRQQIADTNGITYAPREGMSLSLDIPETQTRIGYDPDKSRTSVIKIRTASDLIK